MIRRIERIARVAVLASVFFAGACTHEPSAPDLTGTVHGTVTLLGSSGEVVTTGRVALYSSINDFETGHVAYDEQLVASVPASRSFSFHFAAVRAGTYYAKACFSFGCGEHREPVTGSLIAVVVAPGGETRLDMSF